MYLLIVYTMYLFLVSVAGVVGPYPLARAIHPCYPWGPRARQTAARREIKHDVILTICFISDM